MKFLFLTKDLNTNVGSTRIWIVNLMKWLKEKNHSVYLNEIKESIIPDYCIFQKNFPVSEVLKNKKKYPNSKLGIINPNLDILKKNIIDFSIVGSVEEFEYLSDYTECILFPLIEDYFLEKPKLHKFKKKIIIGYHGNKQHLDNISPNLIDALNDLNKTQNIELHLVYDLQNLGKWNNKNLSVKTKHIQWNKKNILKFIRFMDIGIIPSLTPNNFFDRWNYFFKHQLTFKFKNKTNPGRLYLFNQLGIPAIAEITPSHMQLISLNQNGYFAYSRKSWFKYLQLLSDDHNLRNKISFQANRSFNEKFNKEKIVSNFINDLKNI